MEQKNIEVQRKKGLNLMMKILITAIIPLLILVTFAGLAIRAVGVSVSDKLMQHELKTSIYAVNQTLSVISSGDWNVDGDQLYKGDSISRNIRMCWMLLRRIPDSMLRSAGIRPGWRLAL